jgi:hypothetical protein
VFEVPQESEYFGERELEMQIGAGRDNWPAALAKELIDNALDAAEGHGVAPAVTVRLAGDRLEVADNGPGIPAEIVRRATDFGVRVSTKARYVSPTRGQLGNALKCLIGAAYVVGGEAGGLVEVTARGSRRRITAAYDRLTDAPRVAVGEPVPEAAAGTAVAVRWPGLGLYQRRQIGDLVRHFAALNPQVAFRLEDDAGQGFDRPAADPAIVKWWPRDATCVRWYTDDDLARLIGAYLRQPDRGPSLPLSQFLEEFAGLKGDRKRKGILDALGLRRPVLGDLAPGGELDLEAVAKLRGLMAAAARSVPPRNLGPLGGGQLAAAVRVWPVGGDVRYCQRVISPGDGPPLIIEAAFAAKAADGDHLTAVWGLNWSPALEPPLADLDLLLARAASLDEYDPAVLVVHLVCPRFRSVSRGKGRIDLREDERAALAECLRKVTGGEWRKLKAAKRRGERATAADLARLKKPVARLSIKAAAYRVMVDAYLHASGGKKSSPNGRQVMYTNRERMLPLTGGRCWKDAQTFTQKILPDFIRDHPELTADWDVVYDGRGEVVEPHTGLRVDLGTLEVRDYANAWDDPDLALPEASLSAAVPTKGPGCRYAAALLIEKEGFQRQLEQARIRDRFGVLLGSTKGMSATAARTLAVRLAERGITVYVLHDFDFGGFGILHTLGHDTDRHQFGDVRPKIVDLGLRLADVEELGLKGETFDFDSRQKKDPRLKLAEYGASAAERHFLVAGRRASGWHGRRVELNALTVPQFVAFVERKLTAHGVRRVVPGQEVLAPAYQRAVAITTGNDLLAAHYRKAARSPAAVPPGLEAEVGRPAASSTLSVVRLWPRMRAWQPPEFPKRRPNRCRNWRPSSNRFTPSSSAAKAAGRWSATSPACSRTTPTRTVTPSPRRSLALPSNACRTS